MLLTGVPKADPSLLDSPGSTAAAAGQSDNSDIGFDATKVDILDESLKPKLTLLRVGSSRSTGNVLAVFAGVQNNTGRTLPFEIETIYRDKNGNALNRGSWIKLSLKPRDEIDYKSSSLSEDAVDFTIRIRRVPTVTASAHE